jgi:hypothetical protein
MTPGEIRRRAAVTASTGRVLAQMESEYVGAALAKTAATLADRESALGKEGRALLVESTGLSAEMVDWGLTTTCSAASGEALRGLADSLSTPPRATLSRARLAAIILSGNVFTASLRAIFLPLLARVPVVAKASSRDDVFPHLLQRALLEASAELAASYDVLTFQGGETGLEDSLFAQADVVAAYGSDTTLAEIRSRVPATTSFVPHGHGLGAVWVPGSALGDEELAARVALDVAAYDQRGCLSPHGVWVEGPKGRARAFAERLAASLDELRTTLPRGALPLERGAHQLQWRGVAQTRGDLFEGDGYSVSFEGDAPLRLSPGYRNVSVLTCADVEDFGRRLLPLGVHLKALGVAADLDVRRDLAARLPAPLAPRISAVGTMQTPPLDSLADGVSPWTGLVRFTQVD